jgi:uncharacterized membrane protein
MMATVSTLLMFLTILFLPRLLILAAQKVPVLNTLGSVFLCYLLGLLLSPLAKLGGADLATATDVSSVLVCMAMPLVLFSADLPGLRRLARPMLVSYGMNGLATLIVCTAAFFVFRAFVPDALNMSAMLVGDYIGGTPNIVAIGKSLQDSNTNIALLTTADIFAGGTYFLLLLSVMGPLMRRFLPTYVPVGIVGDASEQDRYVEEFSGKKLPVHPLKTFAVRTGLVGLSLLCFAIAAGITLLLPSRYGNAGLAKMGEFTAVIMIVVTTLGIALSFVKPVRRAPGSFATGQYFILMFAIITGLSFDFGKLSSALGVLGMIMAVQYGIVVVHTLFAKLGRIDADTMIITSTAGIFGPPFIAPVASALKNPEIILPGILCGILGLALSNYLGLGLAYLLHLFG